MTSRKHKHHGLEMGGTSGDHERGLLAPLCHCLTVFLPSHNKIHDTEEYCLRVYYESIKREPKIRGIKKCRCDERLKLKQRNLRASHTLGWSWNWNTSSLKIETRFLKEQKALFFSFVFFSSRELHRERTSTLISPTGHEHVFLGVWRTSSYVH